MLTVPTITQITGIVLVMTGTAAFSLTGFQHATALIPACLGILLVFCGVQGRKERLRQPLTYLGIILGVLGLLGSVRGLMQLPFLLLGQEVPRPLAVTTQSVMAVICAVFLVLCIASIARARLDSAPGGSRKRPT